MPPSKPLRILFLHGFTQNPTLFSAKTAALRKAIIKAFSGQQGYDTHFSYPAGSQRLLATDIPGFDPTAVESSPEDEIEAWGWWVKRVRGGGSGNTPASDIVYEGLEKTLDVVADCIRNEGPFDGAIGFSQGAAAAAMIASLLEGAGRRRAFDERSSQATKQETPYPKSFLSDDTEHQGNEAESFIQPPLKFAVCYSGFRAPENGRYSAFYDPKIKTPVLHVQGQVDVVVDEARSQALIEVCEGGPDRVVIHPGGHFVPSQKPWLDAVVGFIKTRMGEGAIKNKAEQVEEDRAEDMDVPF